MKTNRNCECCLGSYGSGKNYGWEYCVASLVERKYKHEYLNGVYEIYDWLTHNLFDFKAPFVIKWILYKIRGLFPVMYMKIPPQGLCEFCNPHGNKEWGDVWYNPKMKCHSIHVPA